MINNSGNVAVWRGPDTPPTLYHIWLKETSSGEYIGEYIYNSTSALWELNNETLFIKKTSPIAQVVDSDLTMKNGKRIYSQHSNGDQNNAVFMSNYTRTAIKITDLKIGDQIQGLIKLTDITSNVQLNSGELFLLSASDVDGHNLFVSISNSDININSQLIWQNGWRSGAADVNIYFPTPLIVSYVSNTITSVPGDWKLSSIEVWPSDGSSIIDLKPGDNVRNKIYYIRNRNYTSFGMINPQELKVASADSTTGISITLVGGSIVFNNAIIGNTGMGFTVNSISFPNDQDYFVQHNSLLAHNIYYQWGFDYLTENIISPNSTWEELQIGSTNDVLRLNHNAISNDGDFIGNNILVDYRDDKGVIHTDHLVYSRDLDSYVLHAPNDGGYYIMINNKWEDFKYSINQWDNHLSNKNNPHNTTKIQVGLGNVDNTSDIDKPVSTAQSTAIETARLKERNYTNDQVNILNTTISTNDTAALHKASNETVTGVKTFTTLPGSNVTPTIDDHFTNKKYVDDTNVATNTNIATLRTDMQNADNTLTAAVNTETTNRSNADLAVRADFASADTVLQTDINTRAKDANVVHKTGIENISGVKTFSDTPSITGAIVNANDAVTKQYVDSQTNNAGNLSDKVVVNDSSYSSNASSVTETLNKINIKTGATTTTPVNLPVVSATQAGVLTSDNYNTIQQLVSDVNSLKSGGVWRGNFDTYEDLVAAYPGLDVSSTNWFNNDFVYVNSDSNHSNSSTSYIVVNGILNFERVTDIPINIPTANNTSLGIVRGSTTDGKIFVETDGSLSLNGYDAINTTLSNKADKIDLNNYWNKIEINNYNESIRNDFAAADTVLQTNINNLSTTVNSKANDSDVVKLSGDQSISGVKNFIGRITTINPVNNSDVATKAYVDSNSGGTTATDLQNHIANTNNPHSVTKNQVGLGNVDNTSDLSKPISTAMQTALDDKLGQATTNSQALHGRLDLTAGGRVNMPTGANILTTDIANRAYVDNLVNSLIYPTNLTQAQYDALSTADKNNGMLYLIIE